MDDRFESRETHSVTATVDLLATRIASIPDALSAIAPLSFSVATLPRKFVVTGGGLSEGPARFAVALLRQRCGLVADFVPQSVFFARDLAAQPDVTLLMFSQGLAPNARLPLEHAHRFGAAILVTARRDAVDDAVRTILHPPDEEGGLLLRVVGPACACAAALQLCNALGPEALDLSTLSNRYRASATRAVSSLVDSSGALAPIALLAGGRYAELAFSHAWKLLEGLHVAAPPVWDLLQVAHGPMQHFYDRPFTLIALVRHHVAHEMDLFDRIERIAVPGRHRVIRLSGGTDDVHAWFEHDAQLNMMLLDALARTGIDLARWPGQGADGPIYDVAPESWPR